MREIKCRHQPSSRMVTIINTGNDAFHKQVTKARNLQNPVDLQTAAALDDTQERLRCQEMKMFQC